MNRYIVKIGTPLGDAADPNHIPDGAVTDAVVLIDKSTKTKYVLYVDNGELTMSEVTSE